MFTTILVALDGSDYANKALDAACAIAGPNDSALHLIHVAEFRALIVGSASVTSIVPPDEMRAIGKALLEQALERALQNHRVNVELHNVLGNSSPAQAILAKAEEISADLIVVGSLGHSDIGSLLVGSVSHQICQLAKCACLVAR